MADSLADLRAAILANPSDDALRRVYADHLIERADPRGLLIACQLAQSEVGDDKRLHLASRAERLERLHAAQLCHETAALDARYERGFLHTLAMRATELAIHGPRLLAEEPIERLTLYLTPDVDHATLTHLVDLPGLERVRDLALHATEAIDARLLEPFVHAPRLRRLHTLELGTAHQDLAARAVLARWPHEALDLLLLVGALDDTAAHYARSPHLRSLRWLYADSESSAAAPAPAAAAPAHAAPAAALDAVIAALPSVTHLAFPHTPETISPRTHGFRRAPSPRPVSRQTRRITEHVRGSWDLWLRT